MPGMLVFLVLGSTKLPPLRRKSQEINNKYVTDTLNKIADQYLSRSKHLSSAKWAKRSTKDKLLDNIARLTSALQ